MTTPPANPPTPSPDPPPGPELLAIRAELFGSTFVLVQHLARRMDALLAPMGLTTRQWLLLAVIERFFPDRPPSLSEAAEQYGSSRQNVKQIALGLARRGFLRLEPDEVDGRTTRLRLTEQAGVFHEPGPRARGETFLRDIFAGLALDEVTTLHDLVLRWLAASAAASPADRPTDPKETRS